MDIYGNSKYLCPIHGIISGTMQFHGKDMEGIEGDYCIRCYGEKMIELGIQKVEKIELGAKE